MYQDGKGKDELKVMPTLHVAGVATETFRVPTISEGKVIAIMCGRESIVPDPSDWVVLNAGLVFFISADARVLALEMIDGRLQARMTKGVMTDEESTSVQARLNDLQLHFMKDVPKSSETSKK